MIKVGIMGHGKAGQAVAEVLQTDPRFELCWVARRTGGTPAENIKGTNIFKIFTIDSLSKTFNLMRDSKSNIFPEIIQLIICLFSDFLKKLSFSIASIKLVILSDACVSLINDVNASVNPFLISNPVETIPPI